MACLVGFISAHLLFLGHHSYWVLLTIIVILKPGFSLSKQRNYERLIGTIIGGIIGFLLLKFVPNKDAQFILFIALMVGTYSFTRLNYTIAVIFMTPYVFLLFQFLGVTQMSLIQERIIDTAIGSAIALISIYLVLPRWEFEQVNENLAAVVNANANYLARIADRITGKTIDITDFKLARKDIYVKSANLSAMFERMTSEPKSKQKNIRDIHKFVVLNHILSSYLANLGTGLKTKNPAKVEPENTRLIRKSINVLNETAKRLGGKTVTFNAEKTALPVEKTDLSPDEALLREQLGFVNKISIDIERVTERIMG